MRRPRYGGMQLAQRCGMRLPLGVGSTSSVAASYVFSEVSVPWRGVSLRRLLVAACGVPALLGAVGLGAMTVSSWWISCRCPSPELWAGLGSQLYGIAHHISICHRYRYGARVMALVRVYCIPNHCLFCFV